MSKKKKFVAITACPAGLAHTFMAAMALKDKGEELGYEVLVETQGSDGHQNVLTPEDIKDAEAVILAVDVAVDTNRFAGKKVLKTTTSAAIKGAAKLFTEAESAPVQTSGGASAAQAGGSAQTLGEVLRHSKDHLMSGVSHIIPIVVIGGILIAASIALSGVEAGKGANVTNPFLVNILNIGATAFGYLVPILAGYIAFSIAGKPGLAPGFVAGGVAVMVKAGFLGGILGGFIAGILAWYLNKIPISNRMVTIKTIFIIPLGAAVVTCLLMFYVIGHPIAWLMEVMTDFLRSMNGGNRVILGLVIGAMISADMGGPINKVAFLFGTAMIGEGVYNVMGSAAVAICIPPLACGLHSVLRPRHYSFEEREAGKGGLLMGLIGITEGAIPFAVADPLRVIPSIVIGSSVGGAIAGWFGVGDHAPHGGPIVLPVVDNRIGFVIAVLVGIAVTCLVLEVLKGMRKAA